MSATTPGRLAEIEKRLENTDNRPYTEDACDLLDEVKRLREGIGLLHPPVRQYEACPTEWKGCDDPSCTEDPHDGSLYHEDQPVGWICLTCSTEDEDTPWPCETAVLLDPTESPRRARPSTEA